MESIVPILLSISGATILLLFGIIGYFLKIQHSDIRNTIAEQGKLKGKLEVLETKSSGDVNKLQETTQIEMRNMAKNISSLSRNVDRLVLAFTEHNIKINKNQDNDE